MDINRANMDIFFQDLKVEFTAGLNAAVPNLILQKIAMEVPSVTAVTVHGWLNQVSRMREWLGDRQVGNLESAKLSITNRKFEDTREIPREDIEDDMHGLYRPIARAMGDRAMSFKDELLAEALMRGYTPNTWADGVAVFSAAGRKFGDNTICNYSATAFDESGAALEVAYNYMTSYLGHQGKPLMVRPRYILHGPALRSRVVKAVELQYAALLTPTAATYVQTENPNRALVDRIESPYLVNGYVDSKGTSHDAKYFWFLIGEVAGLRGFVYQSRKEPEFQDARTKDDSDFVFATDKYQFGVRMRGEAFIGLPFCIFANYATA